MPALPTTFRAHGHRSEREARREQDARRGSARERGYDSRWDRAARTFRRSHPLCLGCEAVGVIEAATLVDHVEPHRGDQAKFWDRDLWQASCGWHHDVVKQRLEARFDKGEIGAADLWLNSAAAIALTQSLRPA